MISLIQQLRIRKKSYQYKLSFGEFAGWQSSYCNPTGIIPNGSIGNLVGKGFRLHIRRRQQSPRFSQTFEVFYCVQWCTVPVGT